QWPGSGGALVRTVRAASRQVAAAGQEYAGRGGHEPGRQPHRRSRSPQGQLEVLLRRQCREPALPRAGRFRLAAPGFRSVRASGTEPGEGTQPRAGEKPMTKPLALTIAVTFTLGMAPPRIQSAERPVTITQDGSGFTLANGVVTAKVNKRSG